MMTKLGRVLLVGVAAAALSATTGAGAVQAADRKPEALIQPSLVCSGDIGFRFSNPVTFQSTTTQVSVTSAKLDTCSSPRGSNPTIRSADMRLNRTTATLSCAEQQHRFTGSLSVDWRDANGAIVGHSVIPFETIAIPDTDTEEVVNWELGQITVGSSRFAGQTFVGSVSFNIATAEGDCAAGGITAISGDLAVLIAPAVLPV